MSTLLLQETLAEDNKDDGEQTVAEFYQEGEATTTTMEIKLGHDKNNEDIQYIHLDNSNIFVINEPEKTTPEPDNDEEHTTQKPVKNFRPILPKPSDGKSRQLNSQYNKAINIPDGMTALMVCPHCGTLSENFNTCTSCNQVMVKNRKLVFRTAEELDNPNKFLTYSGGDGDVPRSTGRAQRGRGRRRKNFSRSPDIVTVYSDSDEDYSPEETGRQKRKKYPSAKAMLAGSSPISTIVMAPRFNKPRGRRRRIPVISGGSGSPVVSFSKLTARQAWCRLECRSVRIGSYKTHPRAAVEINMEGIFMEVKPLGDENFVKLHIPPEDIIDCVAHFGQQMPILCIVGTSTLAGDVREKLNMAEGSELYYDPDSSDETQRRIIFVLVKMEREKKIITHVCSEWAKSRNVDPFLTEIDSNAANEMLVLTTPPQMYSTKVKKTPVKKVPEAPVVIPSEISSEEIITQEIIIQEIITQ